MINMMCVNRLEASSGGGGIGRTADEDFDSLFIAKRGGSGNGGGGNG